MTAIDGTLLPNIEDLLDDVDSNKDGETVSLAIMRGGQQQTPRRQLGAHPEQRAGEHD